MLKYFLSLFLLTSSLNAQSLAEKVYNSGVVIFQETEYGAVIPVCSGSVIYRDYNGNYLILTAAHCIGDFDESRKFIKYAENLWINGNVVPTGMTKATIAVVGDLEHGRDFAILKSKSEKIYNILNLQRTKIAPFESVMSANAPHGIDKLLLQGNLASEDNLSFPYWPKAFLINMPNVAPGSSGGAIVCASTGEICGIIVGVAFDSGSLVVGIPTLDVTYGQ